MADTVRLLPGTPTKVARNNMKIRTFGAAAALLVLPSLYFFGKNPPPNEIRPYNPLGPSSYASMYVADDVPSGYLVWSPSCRIPDIDPFAADAMHIFKQEKYTACSSSKLINLTHDSKGNGVLHINTAVLDKPISQYMISCCYMNITRPVDPKISDAKVVKSKCVQFNDTVTLANTEEFVLTKCEVRNKKGVRKTYDDAHTNVQMSDELKHRLEAWNTNSSTKPWNVVIFGIDTLSRINLARAMPKTNAYLKENNWLDFQGYNKMDDNTYPNVMAILTGRNQSSARKMCDQKEGHTLDNCDFMWKRYRNNGYATAYGEDYFSISTFGKPLHPGFVHQPTDHYLQPLYIAAEKRVQKYRGNLFCTGQTTSGEVLFDYALKFMHTYRDHPHFGFFWTNTYSHDDISSPSSMDAKVAEFLAKLHASPAIDTTIVLFLSDHGARFGDIRSLLAGYYEERLPALYVWLPAAFKEAHPYAYGSMVANTRRLTTPYDVYMTLEDILKISRPGDAATTVTPSEGCPNCQSLFNAVPWNRSCDDAAIHPHWCTCNPLRRIPANESIAVKLAKFIVDVEIEGILATVNTKKCRICAKIKLDKVVNAYSYKYINDAADQVHEDYLIVFSTKPGAMVFESTVRHDPRNGTMQIQGIVSRLTMYRGKGGCVKTAYLKKYCHCTSAKCH